MESEGIMFIVIEYIKNTYNNCSLGRNEEGDVIFFGSEHSAEQWARVNCVQDYKIAEL